MDRKLYVYGNAYNPNPEEKLKMFGLCKFYNKSCWVPESIAVIGDIYVFYDDVEDLNYFREYVKKYGHNEGHWHLGHKMKKMNYVEITNLYYEYQERGMEFESNYIFEYIKENWGPDYVSADDFVEIERSPFEDKTIEELFSDYWVAMESKQIELANEILIYVKGNFEKKEEN